MRITVPFLLALRSPPCDVSTSATKHLIHTYEKARLAKLSEFLDITKENYVYWMVISMPRQKLSEMKL